MLFSRQRFTDFVASSRDERTIRPDCSDATSQTCATPQTSLSAQLFGVKSSESVRSEDFEAALFYQCHVVKNCPLLAAPRRSARVQNRRRMRQLDGENAVSFVMTRFVDYSGRVLLSQRSAADNVPLAVAVIVTVVVLAAGGAGFAFRVKTVDVERLIDRTER